MLHFILYLIYNANNVSWIYDPVTILEHIVCNHACDRVEELVEDTLVFVMAANLQDRLNISTRMNPTTNDEYKYRNINNVK